MPEDDAREVSIDSQSVIQVGENDYIHVVKVCNRTSVAKDLWVTTKPYQRGRPHKMLGKKKKGKRISIDPNECTYVSFALPNKPHSFYTDVYEYDPDTELHEGRRYAWNLDLAPQPFRFPIVLPHFPLLLAFAAYPRSLEPLGRPLEFRLRGVRGLPDGWDVAHMSPPVGSTFTLNPDEKEYPLNLELRVDKPIAPDTVATVEVDVAVVGQPEEPPYLYRIGLPIVRREGFGKLVTFTHEVLDVKPWIFFRVELEDDLGLLEAPYIHYSPDQGRSWVQVIMDLETIREMEPLGISRATFAIPIPLAGWGAKIWAALVLRDQLGRERRMKIEEYPGSA